MKNPDFRKIGFPGPDFRICVHGVAMGAERATCSQNFRPLAAIEAEIFAFVTIIKYRIRLSFEIGWKKAFFSKNNSTLKLYKIWTTKDIWKISMQVTQFHLGLNFYFAWRCSTCDIKAMRRPQKWLCGQGVEFISDDGMSWLGYIMAFLWHVTH